MGKNRTKTNLVHKIKDEIHEVSRDKKTGKYFIKNTDTEVQPNQLSKNGGNNKNYDFSKPYQAQGLGDEWEHYTWSGDDF